MRGGQGGLLYARAAQSAERGQFEPNLPGCERPYQQEDRQGDEDKPLPVPLKNLQGSQGAARSSRGQAGLNRCGRRLHAPPAHPCKHALSAIQRPRLKSYAAMLKLDITLIPAARSKGV